MLLLLFVLMVIMHATACAWHGVTTRQHWERRVEAFNEHAREDFGDDAGDAAAGEVRYGDTSRRWRSGEAPPRAPAAAVWWSMAGSPRR